MTDPDHKLIAEIRQLRSTVAMQSAQLDAFNDLLFSMAVVLNDELPGTAEAFVAHAAAKERFANDAARDSKAAFIQLFSNELIELLDIPVND